MLPRSAYASDEEFLSALRDRFAGQALQVCVKDMERGYEDWAAEAFALADAMLAARGGVS